MSVGVSLEWLATGKGEARPAEATAGRQSAPQRTPAPPNADDFRTANDADNHIRAIVSSTLAEISERAGISRETVALRMSTNTGERISAVMLTARTSESRKPARFPLQWVVAFELATGTLALTEWLAQARGCRLLSPADVIDAELGRLDRQSTELREKRKKLLLLRAADSRPGSDA